MFLILITNNSSLHWRKTDQKYKTFSFCSGIIFSLVILGALSGFFGKIYGQFSNIFTTSVAIFAIFMGLNLLGLIKFRLPNIPNIESISGKIPSFLTPLVTGITFGFASSPCITPVLATLIAWVAQAKSPTISIIFLFFFGLGQVTPLIIAGATTINLKRFLELRKYSQVIPTFSGIVLISLGILNLLSNWI